LKHNVLAPKSNTFGCFPDARTRNVLCAAEKNRAQLLCELMHAIVRRQQNMYARQLALVIQDMGLAGEENKLGGMGARRENTFRT
jgi:hypothetical protein